MDPTQDLLEALIAICDGNDNEAAAKLETLVQHLKKRWMPDRNYPGKVYSGPRIKPDINKVFTALLVGGYVKIEEKSRRPRR